MPLPRRTAGRLAYLAGHGRVTGYEHFSILTDAAGARTLRADCAMFEDGLTREAVLALDPEARPVEAFVRVVEQGRWMGSAHIRATGGGVEATLAAADGARTEALAGAVDYFGTHALVNDGWVALAAGALAVGESRTVRGATCSHQANGGGVPALMPSEAVLTRFADEAVTVAAGRFDCRHWTVAYQGHTPIDMWTTGPDAVLVLMTWGHLDGRYELVEFSAPLP